MKLVFLLEVPAPYRTPLLTRLMNAGDVHVLYCLESDPWRGETTVPQGHEVLRGWSLGGQKGGVRWKINVSVWRRLSELAPDAVIVNGYAQPTMQLAMIWCRAHRTPYIIHSESHDLTPRRWWKAIRDPLVAFHVKGAAAYLPVSSPAATYLQRFGADADRMFLLPNSPDVRWFSERAKERSPADTYTFLFVGRLVAAKDVSTLISAFNIVEADHPQARLIVAGDGPLKEELQRAAGSTRVTFRDFVPQEELPLLYAQADCFVLPSVYEPFGVVLVEALASGLPVIASDRVGAAYDAIEPGRNGSIYPAGDARELARHMAEMIERDPTSMREHASETAERFEYSRLIENLQLAVATALGEER